jgi:hypothetical protein
MRKKFEFCPKRFEPLRRDRVSSVGDKMWRGCLGQTKDPCPRFPDMREGRKRARKPTGVSFTMNVTKKNLAIFLVLIIVAPEQVWAAAAPQKYANSTRATAGDDYPNGETSSSWYDSVRDMILEEYADGASTNPSDPANPINPRPQDSKAPPYAGGAWFASIAGTALLGVLVARSKGCKSTKRFACGLVQSPSQ